MDSLSMGSRGAWREYRFDDVVSLIEERAGNPSVDESLKLAHKAEEAFENAKDSALSIIHTKYELENDKFLSGLVEKIQQAKNLDRSDFIEYWKPKGQMMSRDMVAIEKGLVTPPHISVLADANAVTFPFKACSELRKLITKVASHIQNLEDNTVRVERIGTNIFIGHGKSSDWRLLKDFVSDRLKLPWDEFNRVCSNCNQYFSRKIERPLLETSQFRHLRAGMNIPNKKGRFPNWQPDEGHNKPSYRLMGRFLGKVGLEVLAFKTQSAIGWNDEIVNLKELDELRQFVRFNQGPDWPFTVRTLHPVNALFQDGNEHYELLHEFDILHTERLESYSVVSLFGVEFVINLGGRILEGYREWLEANGYKSPLYTGKNA